MEHLKLTTVVEFENEQDLELVQFTGYLLQKHFRGYMWCVRLLAKSMIGFSLGELLQYGDNHVMVVHPKDVPSKHEFELIVKRLAGELLERARLNRGVSKNVIVTERPDGFNARFDETIRQTKFSLKDIEGRNIV